MAKKKLLVCKQCHKEILPGSPDGKCNICRAKASNFFMRVYRNYRSIFTPAKKAIELARRFEAKKAKGLI